MAVIDSPRYGDLFKVTGTITFTGHAADPEDGAIPSGDLSWDLEKCNSVQQSVGGDWDFPTPNQDCTWLESLGTGASVQKAISNPGWYRVWLAATNSAGQQGKVYVDVKVKP
jgi:hypothetical protein